MPIGLLGKKLGMTQIFSEDGKAQPVTVLSVGPCTVLDVKTRERDGYTALQLGFEDKKESRVNKPDLGKFKKIGTPPKKNVREVRIDNVAEYKVGQALTADLFKVNDYVDVVGISKGKGFQGGVKQWHWHGGDAAHGSMHHRLPGSIGASSFPSRVHKGHHFPGRMGFNKCTVQNLRVVKVDKDSNILAVIGSVPGHAESIVLIQKSKKDKVFRILKPEVKKAQRVEKKKEVAKKK